MNSSITSDIAIIAISIVSQIVHRHVHQCIVIIMTGDAVVGTSDPQPV